MLPSMIYWPKMSRFDQTTIKTNPENWYPSQHHGSRKPDTIISALHWPTTAIFHKTSNMTHKNKTIPETLWTKNNQNQIWADKNHRIPQHILPPIIIYGPVQPASYMVPEQLETIKPKFYMWPKTNTNIPIHYFWVHNPNMDQKHQIFGTMV